jgi:hypothetical protein
MYIDMNSSVSGGTDSSVFICCAYQNLNKIGKTKDNRQRFVCKNCKKSFTENKRIRGQKLFSELDLLPVLRKDTYELTEGELYSLGFIMADGSLAKKRYQLSITVQERDREVLEIIKRELEIPNEINLAKHYYYPNKDKSAKRIIYYPRLLWSNVHSGNHWANFGISPEKTHNEKWLDYMGNPHFLRGFFDGDGAWYVDGDRAIFCSSKPFLEAIQSFLEPILKNRGSIYFSKGVWNLSYAGLNALELGNYLYQNASYFLNRKHKSFFKIREKLKDKKPVEYILVNVNGKDLPLRQACTQLDLPYTTIFHRIKYAGWSIEKALSTPVKSSKSK